MDAINQNWLQTEAKTAAFDGCEEFLVPHK